MSNSEYQKKLEKAMWELQEKGIRRKRSHTLLFKFLRLLGLQVRLPHYSKPRLVLINCTAYFAGLVGVFLLYVQQQSNTAHVAPIIMTSLAVGLLFGVVMASVTTYNQKKHALTVWENL